MFAPKQKISHVRSRRRTTAWIQANAKRLKNSVSLQYDAAGKAVARSHFASPVTGEYKGRKVIKVGKTTKAKKVRA